MYVRDTVMVFIPYIRGVGSNCIVRCSCMDQGEFWSKFKVEPPLKKSAHGSVKDVRKRNVCCVLTPVTF